jgi:hypothetical protein
MLERVESLGIECGLRHAVEYRRMVSRLQSSNFSHWGIAALISVPRAVR